MIVLGIESSCDETSAAVIKDGNLCSNVVLSQEIHKEYGGVVPEVASREHELHISFIVETALRKANIEQSSLNAVVATYGAGLMGALLVGLNFAKGLALGLRIPFLGVNHMEGHLFANLIENPNIHYPYICMLVSGGHTQIWRVHSFGDYELLANTVDDAAGEAFDKGARLMGLGYPGGPEIQRIAKNGDSQKYKFPRPVVKSSNLNFSFSGLKTALLYLKQDLYSDTFNLELPHIAASYQEAIVDSLLNRLIKIVKTNAVETISVAGGVSANTRFREKAKALEENYGVNICFPKLEFCTDNAAMIAMAGYERLKKGATSDFSLSAVPNLSLGNV